MKNDFKGERINPFATSDETFANHLMRYKFACDVLTSTDVRPLKILDAACGAGYGTAFMAHRLPDARLEGRDISEESIEFARQNYSQYGCTFDVEDLRHASTGEEYDCIVSFETLEHIDFPEQYFDSMSTRLADGGRLILSVPDKRSNIDAGYLNEYHLNEMYLEHLIAYLDRYFSHFQVYVQRQRKINKFRRVIGRSMSNWMPNIKFRLLKLVRRVAQNQFFDGFNFDQFLSHRSKLNERFDIESLLGVDYRNDRICYVVVAFK